MHFTSEASSNGVIERYFILGEITGVLWYDYNTSLAERALPEWQSTLDALQALPEIGTVFVDDALIETARKITVPVEYRIPWNDEYIDCRAGLALFDAFGLREKTLHAHPGAYNQLPEYERDSSARFFARHLRRAGATPA
ncbi:hypothetical protein [Rhodococcus sp. T7]|uniref:hypothetical protein n=1 Tax=Rhodococcus sp. T7 TaxID=627444 RepID=UPI00135BF983|nr:hypothetical protein [Rhodococcus sp. T7]